jgi:hypothetical protein
LITLAGPAPSLRKGERIGTDPRAAEEDRDSARKKEKGAAMDEIAPQTGRPLDRSYPSGLSIKTT